MTGTGFAYTFERPDEDSRKPVQYFECDGHRGIWADGWKAVTRHTLHEPFNEAEWELYHVAEDFAELNDLALEEPERLRQLVDLWWVEAGRNGVLPLDDRTFALTAPSKRPGSVHEEEQRVVDPGRDVESKAAIVKLEEDFTLGVLAPAVIVVDPGAGQNIFAADGQAGVQRLTDGVEAEIARAESAGEHVPFARPFDFQINTAGDTEVVEIPINADIGEQDAIDALHLLREEIVPAAFPDDGPAIALVSGATAGNVDFRDRINARTPIVIAFVVITAFVILVVMYRSLVIPAIAVVLNLLAVGAAYGVLVHVFQEGRALEGLLDFQATGIIESWLPLFVFSITFGISMDYLTFAIGRTQELYQRGYSTEDAIVEGVRDGFGIVFSAAAIMIAVATVFAFTRFIGLQQFGFALALAVLFDATLILLVLLPAMMRLAHDRLWYLPFWLDWLPGGPKDFPEREREEREAERLGATPGA